ncbi:hypothetical protein S245_032591 [Arachis hypogaea]
MHSLTILDFADNRISGHIPSCINNITAMVVHVRSVIAIGYIFYIDGTRYIIPENLMLLMKSKGLEYEDWNLIRIVDLSSNDLLGTMPAQMFRLTELHSLNLSHNQLVGKIPKEIGNMRELESLIYQGINFQGHNFKALVHSATLEILIFVDLHLQKVTHMMVYLEAQSLWMLLLLMMMISLSFGHLSIKNNSV